MKNLEHNDPNRRTSFRLVDTVTIRVRVLDDESLESIVENFQDFRSRYCMKSHVQNQKDVRKPQLIRIKKVSPDVADYLESLEAQIAKLAERLDQDSDTSGDTVEFTDKVDLSSTGVRFRTHLPLVVGMMIEIGMVLSTSNIQVVMLGKVLRVEKRPDKRIAVSVRYAHIHPEDTEAIIRHLARLQQLDLQARRDLE